MSPVKRSVIASRAAQARWRKSTQIPRVYQSVRLQSSAIDDPAYLQEILLEGTLEDWQELYSRLADKPFGKIAQSLEKVLLAEKVYGVTPLWQGILKNLQGSFS